MSEAVESGDGEVPEGYKRVQLGPKELEIPDSWGVEQFGDVFQKRNGSITAPERESIKYVGLDCIESDNIHLQDFDESGKDRSSERAFREGDVLFGKLRPYLNKAARAPFDGICSSDIIPIYAEEDASNEFLLYLMHSKVMRDRAVSTMSGTNLPRTSWPDIALGRVPLPPLEEQRRIAEVLSTVDEKIRETEKIIETTEELKQGLMQDFYTDGAWAHDSYQETSEGELPTNWSLDRVSDHAEIVSGTHVKSDLVTTDSSQTPYLTGPADFDGMSFEVTKYTDSPKTFCEPGDTLITVKGMGCGNSVLSDSRVSISRQLKAIRPDRDLVPEFLFYWIRFSEDRLQILAEGTRQLGLSVSDIASFPLPLPPTEEQREIAEAIQSVETKLADERESRQELQQLKRGLMQDLLTGKVRTPESISADD
jgi:type I restriction enzyme S subunit